MKATKNMKLTLSGSPSPQELIDCITCGRSHPATRTHCSTCGRAHLFPCKEKKE